MKLALAAHREGRLEEAAATYEQELVERPDDPDALHFLGLLRFQSGYPQEGLQLVGRSLRSHPGNPSAWNNFANMLSLVGRPADAQDAYRRTIALAPESAEAYYNLALSLRDEGEPGEAVRYLQQAILRSPNFFRAYETLAMLCYRLGDVGGAAETYRVWSRRDPGNAKARHMAAATSRTNVPSRAGDEYVKLVFDHVASRFDGNLKNLGYRAPELAATMLAEHVAGGRVTELLDAGCGTGLCGPLVRGLCGTLVGVDLSPKMLELAGRRECYDELVVGELCAFMRSRASSFDAVISADTLVYFGAIEEALAGAYVALRPGGVFIATFEALLDDAGSDAFRIEIHGRYVHRESYLRSALEGAGFMIAVIQRETLRQELLKDVVGYLVLARKPDAASA